MSPSEKGFAPLVVILVVMVISGGIVGGTFFVKNNQQKNLNSHLEPSPFSKAAQNNSNLTNNSQNSTQKTEAGFIDPKNDTNISASEKELINIQAEIPEEPEVLRKRRDEDRLTNLSIIQTAINVTAQENYLVNNVFCNGNEGPCFGDSRQAGANTVNGIGWIKIDLTKQKAIEIEKLYLDPVNDLNNHMVFCSDGKSWEVNMVLESQFHKNKMVNDGGDDDSRYEAGSSLSLVDKVMECKY
jgi:hypothetical protein